jgi:hypothetical protein
MKRIAVEMARPAHSKPISFTGEAVWSTEMLDPKQREGRAAFRSKNPNHIGAALGMARILH